MLVAVKASNSIDVSFLTGRTRIKLRKTGETYSLVPPNSKAHNVIVGGTWVDCYGDFKLSNVTTGTQCSLFFTPCGWFGSGRYEVSCDPADSRSMPSDVYFKAMCMHSVSCCLCPVVFKEQLTVCFRITASILLNLSIEQCSCCV